MRSSRTVFPLALALAADSAVRGAAAELDTAHSHCAHRETVDRGMGRMTRFTMLTAALWAMPAAVMAQQPPEWRLSARPILQIGEVEGEPEYQLFKAVSSLRLDDGRLVVLNASSNQVRIYDQQGKFIRAIGRKGAGPSEFSIPVRVYRVGADTLQVF